jgi:hypothetical protein
MRVNTPQLPCILASVHATGADVPFTIPVTVTVTETAVARASDELENALFEIVTADMPAMSMEPALESTHL